MGVKLEQKTKDFLAIPDMSRDEFIDCIDQAIRLKDQTKAGVCPELLKGKMVGCIFHKPSLRTRVSFEVGVHQLGGGSMFITDKEIQLGVRESIKDAGRVLERYLDMIVIRTFHQKDVEELAEWTDAPVINALTDRLHPCQVFCDVMTVREKLGIIEGVKVAYLGDGNNMARSWINAAKLLDIDLWIATVDETHPGEDFVANARKNAEGKVTITDDPSTAVKDADVIYTDVWASMGQKEKTEERMKQLKPYQVNRELMAKAKDSSIVMHCLPAERGKEITDEVIDGPNSVVIDQAENRLHGQKAIMLWTMGLI